MSESATTLLPSNWESPRLFPRERRREERYDRQNLNVKNASSRMSE